jgi:hypothetical protein
MDLHFSGSALYSYSGEPAGNLTIQIEIAGMLTVAVVDTAAIVRGTGFSLSSSEAQAIGCALPQFR